MASNKELAVQQYNCVWHYEDRRLDANIILGILPERLELKDRRRGGVSSPNILLIDNTDGILVLLYAMADGGPKTQIAVYLDNRDERQVDLAHAE